MNEWDVINSLDAGVWAWIGDKISAVLGESGLAKLTAIYTALSIITRATKTEQDDKVMGKFKQIYYLLFEKTNAK